MKLDLNNLTKSIQQNIDDYPVRRAKKLPWHILDFSSVIKHCFYGTNFKEVCPKTGAEVPTPGGALRFFFSVYGAMIFDSFAAAPIQILIAKDGGTDYRSQLFPSYKAKRKARKAEAKAEGGLELDNLNIFSSVLENILVYAGATSVKVKGVEADDIISWLCHLDGHKFLYTNDHDILVEAQREDVTCLLRAQIYDSDRYQPKGCEYEYPLQYLTLIKSLLGDTSDEYPGVPQFGPKKLDALWDLAGEAGLDTLNRAIRYNRFEDLEQFLAAEGLTDAQKKPVRLCYDNRVSWKVQYAVAQTHSWLCWMPRKAKLTKPEWRKRLPNSQKVMDEMSSIGCGDLYQESMSRFMPSEMLITADNWSDDIPGKLGGMCLKSPLTAYDFEAYDTLKRPEFQQAATRGNYLDVLSMKPTGASVCWGDNLQHSAYFSTCHADTNNLREEDLVRILEAVRNNSDVYAAHNAPFEMAVAKNALNVEMWDSHDTLIMSQEVDENERSGLKHLSSLILRYNQTSFDEVVPEGKDMSDVSAANVMHYGCDDSFVTAHLYWYFMIIQQLEGTYDLYCTDNVAPQNILANERLKGVNVDWDRLSVMQKKDAAVVVEQRNKLQELLESNLEKGEDGEFVAQVGNATAYYRAEQQYYEAKALSDAEKAWAKYSEDAEKIRNKQKPTENEQMFIDSEGRQDFITEFVSASTTKALAKLMADSKYSRYEENEQSPEFAVTANKLTAVAQKLEVPDIEKVSKKYIGNYLEENWDQFVTEEQQELRRLLSNIEPVITSKDKTIPEFEELKQFGVRVLDLKGKTIIKGTDLDLNSPAKSKNILYLMLGSDVWIRGKKSPGSLRDLNRLPAAPSAGKQALEWAAAKTDQEWVKEAISCMKMMKSALTREGLYYSKYPLWRHPKTDNIHPEFRWNATATGRPTGSNPNFLQLSEVMRQVVKPYKDDHKIIGIDWAGLELRLTAGQCGDASMVSAYCEPGMVESYREQFGDMAAARLAKCLVDYKGKVDLHSFTASGMVGMSYQDFLSAHDDESNPRHDECKKARKGAKVINFGLIYGMSAPSLAEKLIIDRDEGNGYVGAYMGTYPGMPAWQERMAEEARRNGFTRTAYGSVRHATDNLFDNTKGRSARMIRQLINATIQGTAADQLKRVMSGIWKSGLYHDCDAAYVFPIYDEVVASTPDAMMETWVTGMKYLMEQIVPTFIPMPMETDVAIGHNWGEVKDFADLSDWLVIRQELENMESGSDIQIDYEADIEDDTDDMRELFEDVA